MLKVLSDGQLERIHSKAIHVLEKVGVRYQSEETGQVFASSGATIDEKARMVRIPEHLVNEALKKTPSHFTLGAFNQRNSIELREGRFYTRPSTGFSKVIDSENGMAREGTSKDSVNISRLIQQLDNISINSTHVFPCDVHQEIKDVYSFSLALENSDKHVVISPLSKTNLRIASDIASVYELESEPKERILSALICPVSPLTLRDEVSVLCAKARIPAIVNSAPILGVASPVTLAGTLVLQSAESLATITLIQLVQPGSSVILGNKSTPMDMKHGTPLSGTVEIGLLSAAAVQVAKFYNIPSEGFGTRTDSKTLDEQAGIERIFVGLLPALAGATIDSGAGAVEIVATFSLEQLVIDDEVYGMTRRLLAGVEVDEQRLAFDEIRDVGPGGSFLGKEHTRRFYSDEHYQHRLFDKRSRKDWENAGFKDVRQVARERVKKLLSEYKPSLQLGQKGKEKVREILKEAARLYT